MVDATIQKPSIDTLFHGTKVVKLMSNVRLEFNIDFIDLRVYFCILNKCEITIIIVGNFETILSVNMTKEKRFQME